MADAFLLAIGHDVNTGDAFDFGNFLNEIDAELDPLGLLIFSAFMLYDIRRVIDGGETNYISATLAIYLDVFNVFQSLLSLLGLMGGERD